MAILAQRAHPAKPQVTDLCRVLKRYTVLNSFRAAADLMAAGAIDTGPMLGPPFALDQFPEELTSVRNGEGIKIQVAPAS